MRLDLPAMQTPSCVHPKRFKIQGITFEVVTLGPVSEAQAAKIAMHFFRTHKFKKLDQGKLFQVRALFDRFSANLL